MNASFWLSLFFLTIIGLAVATGSQWSWATGVFPWAIGIPAFFLALCQVVLDFKNSRADGGTTETATAQILDIPMDQSIPKEVSRRATIVACLWILFFVFSIWLVGLLPASLIFVFSYLRYQAGASIKLSAATASLTTLFIWGLFDQIMHTAWPEALLFDLLG